MAATVEGSEARRRHYGEFYGLLPMPPKDRPLAVVHGNCQAEAIRVVLAGSTQAITTIRIPPVHELEASDMVHLRRVLARTSLLLSQPVRDDYRGLPLGTRQLGQSLAEGGRAIMWPVVRYTGLHPHAALVRTPWRGDPPVVPYHDLRTVVAVARGLPASDRPRGHGRAEGYREVARWSLDELRKREDATRLVPVSDLLVTAGAEATLTINHPGNAVLVPLAGRLLAAAGIGDVARDPGRTLLPSIQAPVDRGVLAALDLDLAAEHRGFRVGSERWTEDDVAAAQHGWYVERPEVVEAAISRYRPAIEALGL